MTRHIPTMGAKGAKSRRFIQSMIQQNLLVVGMILGLALYYVGEKAMAHLCLNIRLASDTGKSFYTLGQFYARRVDSMRLTPSEARLVAQGFNDWAGQRKAQIDFDSNQFLLQNLTESRQAKAVQAQKEEGDAYLKKFLKSGGLLSLSGLGYRILIPGSKKKPGLQDWVEVSYRGSLTNGQLVDSTDNSGGKTKIPMSGIIPGWTEGLQMVGEGGEVELVIPPQLAYGNTENPSGIPPGATLIFRIQLHRIIPAGRVNES